MISSKITVKTCKRWHALMASIDIGFFFWWNTTNPKNTSWHLSGFQPDRSLMWNTGQNAIEIIHRVMMGNANPEVQDLHLLSWLPILKYPKVTICYWHGRKFAPSISHVQLRGYSPELRSYKTCSPGYSIGLLGDHGAILSGKMVPWCPMTYDSWWCHLVI